MSLKKFEEKMAEHAAARMPKPKPSKDHQESPRRSWLGWGILFLFLIVLLFYLLARYQ